MFSCSACGKTFDSKPSLSAHKGSCESYKSITESIKTLASRIDSNAPASVYVLLVQHLDSGEQFYYIGQTRRPLTRAKSHFHSGEISIPSPDGVVKPTDMYEVCEVVETIGCDLDSRWSKEREVYNRWSEDEDNVYGGK
jgi:hypothetical protein